MSCYHEGRGIQECCPQRHLGNVEKEIRIDTTPPEISVLSGSHNITQGGSGLIIYKLSERCGKSGVRVGDHFFPGSPGLYKDDNILATFFALGHDQRAETPLYIEAEDRAGNASKAGFPHLIKRKPFKSDVINISDGFLARKMPEFDNYLAGGSSDRVESEDSETDPDASESQRMSHREGFVVDGDRKQQRQRW